jgi:Spy/CpxP family protein refolding chaperone
MSYPKTDQATTGSKAGLWSRLAAAAFIVVVALAISTGTAFSQDDQQAPPPAQGGEMGGHGGGHRQMPSADEQLKHMTKKLDLTADQQPKIKSILDDQHAKMEALHNDSSMSREDKFPKMREIRENSDTQIKAILNEDQQKKFDKMQQEQHDRMGHQGPPPPSN